MDIYGRIQGVPPSTPSRRQHQRYSSADFDINANERAAVRSQYPSTRLSLPSPGSRASPQSLPPQHQRRQAGHPPVPPHYVTPTRARHPSTSAQQARAVRVDPEQWESLRSKGFVLKGSGDVQRSSVTFAPALSVIPVSPMNHHELLRSFPDACHSPEPDFVSLERVSSDRYVPACATRACTIFSSSSQSENGLSSWRRTRPRKADQPIHEDATRVGSASSTASTVPPCLEAYCKVRPGRCCFGTWPIYVFPTGYHVPC